MRQQPPPLPQYRPRTPSGHDVPIPESVFHAVQAVQQEVRTSVQQAAAWQANHDAEHAKLGKLVATAMASKRHDWAKIIAAIAAAVPLIIGGVRATAPTPPAPVQVLTPNALGNELEACGTLQDSVARMQCQLAAAERDRLRRGARP